MTADNEPLVRMGQGDFEQVIGPSDLLGKPGETVTMQRPTEREAELGHALEAAKELLRVVPDLLRTCDVLTREASAVRKHLGTHAVLAEEPQPACRCAQAETTGTAAGPDEVRTYPPESESPVYPNLGVYPKISEAARIDGVLARLGRLEGELAGAVKAIGERIDGLRLMLEDWTDACNKRIDAIVTGVGSA